MKKINFLLFNIIFTIVSTIAIFGFINFNSNNSAAAAPNTQTETASIFDISHVFSITQDNKVYSSEEDFSTIDFKGQTYKALYTNQALTITFHSTANYQNYHFVNLSTFEGTTKLETINKDNPKDIYDPLNEPDLGSGYPGHINEHGFRFYRYVFNPTTILEDEIKFVQLTYIFNHKTYIFDFMLINTTLDFSLSQDLYWQYKYNSITERIYAPTNGSEYTPLTLRVPNGSELNPVYVRFTYLGQSFLVYNINGTYYNAFNNDELSTNYVFLNQSGQYTVEIFDKTSYTNPNSNYLIYNFYVKNLDSATSKFYIHAHHDDGSLVADMQISNDDVIVDFVNIDSLIKDSVIDRVLVTKSWKPSVNENVSEKTEYSDLETMPSSLTFTQDGTYNIRVFGRNNGNIIKEYEFILIKTFRSYFEKDGIHYEISDDEPENTFKEYTIDSTIQSSYNDIYGETDYQFNITIAKSSPNISGISNNGRKQGGVILTIYGVGKINVAVTVDGNSTEYTVQNGEKLEKLKTAGKYVVKITDEMGTTVTKTFTVTVKMNTAAKLIIIIGIGLVVAAVTIIVLKRSKIKVR